MVDKIQKVSNPLTIIAIFAGLAEVAATVALGLIAPDIQKTFIWFVMLFPVLLVVLFFLVLWFNSKALYAPGDYKSDESFISVLLAKNEANVMNVNSNLDEATKSIETTKKEIIEEIMNKLDQQGSSKEIPEVDVEILINDKFEELESKLNYVKQSIKIQSNENLISENEMLNSKELSFQNIINNHKEPNFSDIIKYLGISKKEGIHIINKLNNNRMISMKNYNMLIKDIMIEDEVNKKKSVGL